MRLIDADKLHYIQLFCISPKTGKLKKITAVRASEINKAPTIPISKYNSKYFHEANEKYHEDLIYHDTDSAK